MKLIFEGYLFNFILKLRNIIQNCFSNIFYNKKSDYCPLLKIQLHI